LASSRATIFLAEQKPGALPKSPLGAAVGYAANNWGPFKRYLDQGFLAIDNNLSEQTLRAIALGRNNWGVIGSDMGRRTAVVLSSVVGTSNYLLIDPFTYLRDVLPGLFALGQKPMGEQLLDWLPDRWRMNRSRSQTFRDVVAVSTSHSAPPSPKVDGFEMSPFWDRNEPVTGRLRLMG
jgi:hypothetical protein